MLHLLFFYSLGYKQNTVFVAFLKSEEAYVGYLLYRNAQAILSNLVQLLPSKLGVSISNSFSSGYCCMQSHLYKEMLLF